METSINIDVARLDTAHRQAMEDVVGQPLQANQRLIIQVATVDACLARPQVMDLITHFYDGLSDAEVEAIDQSIKTRANLTRPLP